ncbi:hypothetical protein AB6A40_005784 [Gnathostoma spinigerum]|uniref:Uncharacterized protein n=1 Tax=Gnathostoma spinigerum TaxID=75299 RepID=A0ABD6EHL7_9BILA
MSLKKSDTLPIPLTNTSQEYGGLPRNRCSANLLADSLGKSPAYQQRDSERWNAAINRYQEFLSSNRGQCCTSPPNSPVDESGIFSRLNISGGGLAVVNGSSLEAIPPRRESIRMAARREQR